MARTVVALYDDFASANAAVRELVDSEFIQDDISLLASDATGEYGRIVAENAGVKSSAAAQGASTVMRIEAPPIDLEALAISGIGPVLAAGPLAAALNGLAGVGASAGVDVDPSRLIGALMDMGIPEETTQYYAEAVRRACTLVIVRTDDHMTDRAVDILNRHDPLDVNERVSQWRQSGWTGFNANAETYRNGETSADMVSSSYADYSTFDHDFRNHFAASMYGSGYTYEQYQPAYRYGYKLATDNLYRDRGWEDLEPEAQQYWEDRNPGTWARIKGAVHHAWEEVKDTVS